MINYLHSRRASGSPRGSSCLFFKSILIRYYWS